MRIEVLPDVPESLAGVTERVGSTQVSVVSRLIEWFVNQPDVTQAGILGLFPGNIQKELSKMVIERMRAEAPKGENQLKASKSSRPDSIFTTLSMVFGQRRSVADE
jgi:hypothetical protein